MCVCVHACACVIHQCSTSTDGGCSHLKRLTVVCWLICLTFYLTATPKASSEMLSNDGTICFLNVQMNSWQCSQCNSGIIKYDKNLTSVRTKNGCATTSFYFSALVFKQRLDINNWNMLFFLQWNKILYFETMNNLKSFHSYINKLSMQGRFVAFWCSDYEQNVYMCISSYIFYINRRPFNSFRFWCCWGVCQLCWKQNRRQSWHSK